MDKENSRPVKNEFAKKPWTGDFCWIEILTTDLAKVKPFYTKVFNWEYLEMPMPGENTSDGGSAPVYTMMKPKGTPEHYMIGGLFPISNEMKMQNVNAGIANYVMVENTDAICEKVQTLGGKVCQQAMDVGNMGRMAVLQDSTGAFFNVWQEFKPRKLEDTPEINRLMPGMYSWQELTTDNVDAAASFYSSLFNWDMNSKRVKMSNGEMNTYVEISNDGKWIGGLMQTPPQAQGTPPCWTTYFNVENVDTTVKTIEQAGGAMRVPVIDVKGVGRFGVATDPCGAAFAFIQYQ